MPTLPILTYHSIDPSGSVISVDPDTFSGQLACLAKLGYRGVSLREALAEREERGTWPERTVAITFDDGYENLRRQAAPALARHGFTATVYLITNHVGGVNDWETPPSELGRQPMLDWGQVEELQQEGWEIGGHTLSHPDLRLLSAEAIQGELSGCRDAIAQQLGSPTETFAYPYGHTPEAAIAAVADTFRAGCTTVLRRATNEAPEVLPRIDTYYLRDPARLKRLVSGRLDAYLTLRRWGRAVR